MIGIVWAIAAWAADPATLHVDGTLEKLTDGGLAVRVQASAPASGGALTVDEPAGIGVTLTPLEDRTEEIGVGEARRVVQTRTWRVSGPPGRFVVDALCARQGGGYACSETLYVDLGAPPPRPDMADIVEPPPVAGRSPWGWATAALLASAVLAWAWRTGKLPHRAPREAPVAPPERPDVAALRRWDAIRRDVHLSDADKALALSEIFRAYAEATLDFPARALSTTETLAHLSSLPYLLPENVIRARRVLRATDRVKYAEVRPGEDLFLELDADLRAFIEATRPHVWSST
jgi:hypothetical protein